MGLSKLSNEDNTQEIGFRFEDDIFHSCHEVAAPVSQEETGNNMSESSSSNATKNNHLEDLINNANDNNIMCDEDSIDGFDIDMFTSTSYLDEYGSLVDKIVESSAFDFDEQPIAKRRRLSSLAPCKSSMMKYTVGYQKNERQFQRHETDLPPPADDSMSVSTTNTTNIDQDTSASGISSLVKSDQYMSTLKQLDKSMARTAKSRSYFQKLQQQQTGGSESEQRQQQLHQDFHREYQQEIKSNNSNYFGMDTKRSINFNGLLLGSRSTLTAGLVQSRAMMKTYFHQISMPPSA